MAQVIPIRDLKNTAAISEKCRASNEPIFITKNGYGDMVLMSMEVYNRTMARHDLYLKLKEAEDEIEAGVPARSWEEVYAELTSKYGKML